MKRIKKFGLSIIVVGTAAIVGSLYLKLWCRHKYNGPFSRKVDGKKQWHQICFKCGEKFEYDPLLRKRGKSLGKTDKDDRQRKPFREMDNSERTEVKR